MKYNRITVALCLIIPALVSNANAATESDQTTLKKDYLELQQKYRQLKVDYIKLKKLFLDQSERLSKYRQMLSANYIEVRDITRLDTGKSGFNASNPTWSPNGQFLAFDRADQTNREIIITDLQGNVVHSVSYKSADGMDELDLILPELGNTTQYNTGISWSPNSRDFVYMSNGAEGNYDIYQGSIGSDAAIRLTEHPEKEGHAQWSPVSGDIVYVSGKTGSANLYVLSLDNRKTRQLTNSKVSSLYPVWSPDGSQIVFTYGENQNHNIAIISATKPGSKPQLLVDWNYDDVRPVWSPNGKHIAFYTNYGDDRSSWSLVVIPSDAGKIGKKQLPDYIIASGVIPDIENGPAWTPDGKNILYVSKDEKRFNPIHMINISSMLDRTLMTETRINNDINISKNNVIAFRSQLNQWDSVFHARLPGSK